MDLKKREFLNPNQGRMDLQAYGREFNHLSRYAPRDVTNDEDKQYLFRQGMTPLLRYELLPFKFTSSMSCITKLSLWSKEGRS